MIELVAAAHRTIGRKQRRPGQRQIADRVERLVADEFVRIAQAFGLSTRSSLTTSVFSK